MAKPNAQHASAVFGQEVLAPKSRGGLPVRQCGEGASGRSAADWQALECRLQPVNDGLTHVLDKHGDHE